MKDVYLFTSNTLNKVFCTIASSATLISSPSSIYFFSVFTYPENHKHCNRIYFLFVIGFASGHIKPYQTIKTQPQNQIERKFNAFFRNSVLIPVIISSIHRTSKHRIILPLFNDILHEHQHQLHQVDH